MQLETGLLDHMVMQRDRRNVSWAPFAGGCAMDGAVFATVRRGGKAVAGFARRKVGVAANGRMAGCLKGVPVGGPYDVELAVGAETVVVRDVLVGDVWLLGGQSNMQGCGFSLEARDCVAPHVRAFYMNDRWAVAQDPLHDMSECVDSVHVSLCAGVRPARPGAGYGVGPGPTFGIEMQRLSGVPQGLIACAHGGTSMSQWRPGNGEDGGRSLYGAMLRRLRKNGGRVAGLIWYQGESDAQADLSERYTDRMKDLVAALRRDAGDQSLPVVIVQIARVIVDWWSYPASAWNSIQEQQRVLGDRIARLATVPAIDLVLDDGIHIGGAGHFLLGRRLAQAMQALRGGRKAGPAPIAVKGVTVEDQRGRGVIVVEFAPVVGRLVAGSRPSGFTLVTDAGIKRHFDVELDGNCARIRTEYLAADLTGTQVYYGYGLDPYCNIRDEAGRSLPAFGPIPAVSGRAFTPFASRLRVSAFQTMPESLAHLTCPTDWTGLGLTDRTFTDKFCSLRPDIEKLAGADRLVYCACRFTCPEAMRLALLLGYDGPVVAWVDGMRVVYDPDGVNPATPEKAVVKFRAGPGMHEIVVALGTHHGNAWGVFVRLENLGVSRKALLKGPAHYVLPELLG